MAFTETQLLPQEANQELVQNLTPFALYRQDHSSDKYSSMAVCTRSAVKMSINALKLNILNTSLHEERTFTLLLLYRKQSVNSAQYVRNVTTVENSYSIAVILGDFNINYLNSTEAHTLKSVMGIVGLYSNGC